MGACSPRAERHEVTFESGVAMKTRDGVTLRADIYRPKGKGKYPVLMVRTPYNKSMSVADGIANASRGYVFIVQDVRGRESSEGEWYPFRHEGPDGYDAVEWAAALPYSNGKVGLTGWSYPGITALAAALEQPPHLVAIQPGVAPSSIYGQLVYSGGAYMQALTQAWGSAVAVNEHSRKVAATALPTRVDPLLAPADYPLLDPVGVGEVGKYYHDWIAHPAYDDYWRAVDVEEKFARLQVPALHLGGWYDVFQPGTLRNYVGLKQHAGTAAARQGQRLLMIPGGHAGLEPKIGEVDFGPNAKDLLGTIVQRWFDWQLKGIASGSEQEKPVMIFVMGENVFRGEDAWPLARAVPTRYHLHSGGRANSRSGDGRLGVDAPGGETADRFTYDPTQPVPTHGGAILGAMTPGPGPYDQGAIEDRPDVLVYTTPPMEKALEVTGPVSLEAYVSSSAVDTDLVGKLVDVNPDGRAINLTEGILRLRYRNSLERAELMAPDETCKVIVDLWATANVFLPGHRLRLEVTSSSFPRFDRNLNVAANPETAATPVKATTTILHDRDHPSALILPVVPR